MVASFAGGGEPIYLRVLPLFLLSGFLFLGCSWGRDADRVPRKLLPSKRDARDRRERGGRLLFACLRGMIFTFIKSKTELTGELRLPAPIC
jgi:hypothetical protein